MNSYREPTLELSRYFLTLTRDAYSFAHAYYRAEYQGRKQPRAANYGLSSSEGRAIRVAVERAMGLYEEPK